MKRNGIAKKLVLGALGRIEHGFLRLHLDGDVREFGNPDDRLRADLRVHDERFFGRVLLGGDIAAGESYMDGEWSTTDLTALLRLAVRNLRVVESSNGLVSFLSRIVDTVRHRFRSNTEEGSRRNISEHYDLSNEFFAVFLDPTMMYSCAWYEGSDDTLERAQIRKLDRICRKLRLTSDDHVLEIGTGWGGFAIHAAREYGCRVTTTTISREQYDYACEVVRHSGLRDRIEVVMQDYRTLQGQFDKIVSIEMFEAVGFEFYDDYFSSCDRLLRPDGTMLLQTITIRDDVFDTYRKRSDWIQKYIFPGAELASVGELLQSLKRGEGMSLYHLEDMGVHYGRTLRDWRARFDEKRDAVKLLGFGDRFIRMWEYYLSYCEAGFLERHISDVQLVLTKNHNGSVLFTDPDGDWSLSEGRSPISLVASM